MQRIRLCHLITELAPAGAERCIYELSTRLDHQSYEVSVIALRGGAVADWLARAGIDVHVLDVRTRWDVAAFCRLVKLLRQHRPDILHTHLFHADLVGRPASRLAGVPHLVHSVHVVEGRFRPWQFAFARTGSRRYDRIVAVSQSVAESHSRRCHLPRRLYEVIYNGVDLQAFSFNARARRDLRSKWGLTDEQVLLAFVGRLNEQKGVDTLLSAVGNLGARGKPVNLVIAGDGPQRHLVEEFIVRGEGGSRARFLGVVQDVPAILSAADVLVMPSRWEGFGLAAAEAMAVGRPVIAGDVPGLREVVLHEQTGLLIPPQNSASLASAIERLLAGADLRARLGHAGRERIAENFSIQKMVAAHDQLYRRLVESNARQD